MNKYIKHLRNVTIGGGIILKMSNIKDRFDFSDLDIPLEYQLEELEFLRDRYKEGKLKLKSLEVAQLYITIGKLKEEIKKQNA